MDLPIVNGLFKAFGRHHFCHQSSRPIIRACSQQWRREQSTRARPAQQDQKNSAESSWQQRSHFMPLDKSEEFKRYPTVTANGLRNRKEPPRRVKMLMRDFIEDSLYNPHYGYFSKNATIFSPGQPFDFTQIKDEPEFYRLLGQKYAEFEDKLDEKQFNEARQLWHTPTELFRPYYGEAIARYMIANYKLTLYPYHDLVIYEMGAGNGTLMLNILDYIRHADPEVYARTKFRIIEVSSALAALQAKNLKSSAASRGHASKVEIINKSIFDWDLYVPTPCFFLAMEVFDNFAHDVLRYDPFTYETLQGSVLIDNAGEFYEFYTQSLDPVAARFLRVREAACADRAYPHPLGTHQPRSPSPTRHSPRSAHMTSLTPHSLPSHHSPSLWHRLRHRLPFAPNLTTPEYIPTRLLQFFTILTDKFPAHRLITSDFHSLPQAVAGVNAPVVQTRYRRRTVPVTTPLVQQGYFDILFPTDFGVMEDIYRAVTGRLTRVMTHEDFFRRWSFVEETTMRSGENALLGWYRNASVMVTV